jgi:ATP-dependent DNA ligase
VQDDAGAAIGSGRPEGQTSGEVVSAPLFLSKSGRYKPMLASAMPERFSVTDYATEDWALEEKYDGHRIVACVTTTEHMRPVEVWSRSKERPDVPQHVLDAFRHLPDGVYDGELVFPGGDFSDVRRIENRPHLRVVLFDAVELLGETLTALSYDERREALEVAVMHHTSSLDEGQTQIIHLASSEPVSLEAVERIWQRGGEGAILKLRSSVYRCGARASEWIKVKKSGSVEATIVGYKKGKNDPYGSMQIRLDDGTESAVKVLTVALKNRVTKDPQGQIGKRIVVQITNRNKAGALVNPVFDHYANEGD